MYDKGRIFREHYYAGGTVCKDIKQGDEHDSKSPPELFYIQFMQNVTFNTRQGYCYRNYRRTDLSVHHRQMPKFPGPLELSASPIHWS